MDGLVRFKDEEDNFPLKIGLASKRFRLLQNSDHSHFAIVRDKLNWGAPAIRDSES